MIRNGCRTAWLGGAHGTLFTRGLLYFNSTFKHGFRHAHNLLFDVGAQLEDALCGGEPQVRL